MRKLLDKYSDVFSDESKAFHHHQPESQLRNLFETSSWDVSEYVVFTTVRNPWARVFSYHNYMLRVAGQPEEAYSFNPGFYRHCREYSATKLPFPERVGDVAAQLPTQASFLLEPNETVVEITRLEFLSADLRPLWKRLGLEISDLDNVPFTNRSSNTNYRRHYTREAIEIVAETHADDINRFGYTFDFGL